MTKEETKFKAFACANKMGKLTEWSYVPRELGGSDIGVKISHCGICFSDIITMDSIATSDSPCVAGHEIVGEVYEIGKNVTLFHIGDIVGIGGQILSCQDCDECRTEKDQLCSKRLFMCNKYPDGQASYGGYAEKIRISQFHAFKIPKRLSPELAAPLLCAGITVYSPLVKFGVKSGMHIGVVGIGGLGHLAVQFASKMGANVVAISHSINKKEECTKLGCSGFVNINDSESIKTALKTLDIILVTSTHVEPSIYCQLLKNQGKLILIAIPEEPLKIDCRILISRELTLTGSVIGSRKSIEEMLQFAAEHDVKPWIEIMPMQNINEAIHRVREGKPRYRIVLKADFQ